MATFIEIRTDAFASNLESMRGLSSAELYSGVRRPVRGIEIKEDTYAVIKVLKANGEEIPLTDAGGVDAPVSGTKTGAGSKVPSPDRALGASTTTYSNFLIQHIQESRAEKSQVLETFGDAYIFFFGERPRLLQVQGVLINTTDFNWRSEFWYNYENTLRGTKLVEQNARIYLFYDDIVVEGYMLQAAAQDDADTPYHIPFSFQLFLTNHTYLSQIGSDDYPITHAVNLQPLLQDTDRSNYRLFLLQQDQSAQKYISTTEVVREAAQQAELERIAESPPDVLPSSASAVLGVKNLLLNALMMGINAQNLTFLSIVNQFFKNRKMRFPKGLAGGEAYVGKPQYANAPDVWDANPQRTLPLRSKIFDNIDEYVNGGGVHANLDQDAITAAMLANQSQNPYLLEQKLMGDLAAMGLNPIQHPGSSPLAFANGLISIPTEIPDVLLRAFGPQ